MSKILKRGHVSWSREMKERVVTLAENEKQKGVKGYMQRAFKQYEAQAWDGFPPLTFTSFGNRIDTARQDIKQPAPSSELNLLHVVCPDAIVGELLRTLKKLPGVSLQFGS